MLIKNRHRLFGLKIKKNNDSVIESIIIFIMSAIPIANNELSEGMITFYNTMQWTIPGLPLLVPTLHFLAVKEITVYILYPLNVTSGFSLATGFTIPFCT